MLRLFGLVPFAFAIALLSCDKADPVDDETAVPPDSLAGDAAAVGLAAPANAATTEAVQQAAFPDATGGLGWTYRDMDRAALFGPPGNPAFSIQCQKQREGESQLIFIRHLPPTTGSQATLSFTGNGQAASVPISAVSNPNGAGSHWHAAISPGDNARDIAEAFAGPGTVKVSISGTPPLVVSAAPEARRVFSDCLESGA